MTNFNPYIGKTPVKLTNVKRTVSYRSPGFDIKFTNRTQISPVKLNFTFEKPTTTNEVQKRNIKWNSRFAREDQSEYHKTNDI